MQIGTLLDCTALWTLSSEEMLGAYRCCGLAINFYTNFIIRYYLYSNVVKTSLTYIVNES